jgi:hypothetical protein
MDTATAPDKQYPSAIRFLAHLISIVFHPLFITSYVAAFLIYVDPYAFATDDDRDRVFRLASFIFNTTFIPLFSVLLMRWLGLIESLYLRTGKERIIPYVAAMICYFWAWLVTRNRGDAPDYFVHFMLGSFLAICAAFMINIYVKVSMHTIAMGGALTFFLLQALSPLDTTGLYFTLSLLVAGLVGTSRMIVSDHRPAEIYIGYITGAVCQLVATIF